MVAKSLVLDGLRRVHADGTVAVDGVGLRVEAGELVAVVGPSGCGKSTLLRLIAGVEPLTAGQVLIGGEPVQHLLPHQRDVAMVFEGDALYPHLTVEGNLRFGLDARKTPPDEVAQRVGAEARAMGIRRLLRRRPRTLAMGARQRVALARATVRVPSLFLLDEPLGHLDPGQRVRLRGELARLQRGLGVSTLYVTHDQAEAMAVGGRLAVMRAGRFEQVGTARELYRRPATTFVAGFLGDPGMALALGRLTGDGGAAAVELAGRRLPVTGGPPAVLLGRLGQPVVAGIRPEHLAEAVAAPPGAARLPATVSRLERPGPELLAHCDIEAPAVAGAGAEESLPARTTLAVRLPRDRRLRRGEPLELAVQAGALSLFDPVSGAALWHGA